MLQIGLRVILTMTNYYSEFGGVQFYVDATLGSSYAPETFYYASASLAAYQNWVRPF